MHNNPFQAREPNVADNELLRIPQREAYSALDEFARDPEAGREGGIVLPVGCGKSGCITLAPFAFKSIRTLVIAPSVRIAEQLHKDFDPSLPDMFYNKCNILAGQPYPEPVDIRGTTTNIGDLKESNVVITNIQQLQGAENHWLEKLPADFFDLILFDEGHHNVAASWETLRGKFPQAKIVNFSATPLRADGQLMAGHILYSYPIFRAIQQGYVKRLKAVVLNPRTLRFVRREDGEEIEVSLEEVRRLGEQDAKFRRGIVTSTETLTTIVDASIRELDKLRKATGDKRLKIIASALNFEHCGQIVEAYQARGRRADYVHSREDSAANKRVFEKLDHHELDVIVQVRKLGEGFDHRYLSVAAVFSIYSNLSPFVQFVGRVMRVIEQDAPGHPLNYGVVVFHAGANIAARWDDFQKFSEADQDFFDQLLPMEGLDFSIGDEIEVEPLPRHELDQCEVMSQDGVVLEEIPLIPDDPVALEAFKVLRTKGYTSDQVKAAYEAYEELEPVHATKARQRQAKRSSLDMRVRTEAARILRERGINFEGHELDRKRLGKTNGIIVMTVINRHVNNTVGRKFGERHDFGREELDKIEREFSDIVERAKAELYYVET